MRVEYISAHSYAINLANTVFQPKPTLTQQETKAIYQLISKNNISDMRRHMKYARRIHPDDSTSAHLIVKNYN